MKRPTPTTPDEAIRAFYAAFEARSAEAMMAVWARRFPVACIHPTESRLEGRAAIERSWATMFRAAPPLRIELQGMRVVHEGGIAVQTVDEVIHVEGDPQNRPPILATNVFMLEDGVWRMTLHHASAPSPSGRGEVREAQPGRPRQLH